MANTKPRHVYCIYHSQGFFKIGVATHVGLRLNSFQVGSPYRLRLIGYYEADDAWFDEAQWHAMLSEWKQRGEWFKVPREVAVDLVTYFSRRHKGLGGVGDFLRHVEQRDESEYGEWDRDDFEPAMNGTPKKSLHPGRVVT